VLHRTSEKVKGRPATCREVREEEVKLTLNVQNLCIGQHRAPAALLHCSEDVTTCSEQCTLLAAQRYVTQATFQGWSPNAVFTICTPGDGCICARNMLVLYLTQLLYTRSHCSGCYRHRGHAISTLSVSIRCVGLRLRRPIACSEESYRDDLCNRVCVCVCVSLNVIM
jgi:hypothetical protein